jgi:hypothetical protein
MTYYNIRVNISSWTLTFFFQAGRIAPHPFREPCQRVYHIRYSPRPIIDPRVKFMLTLSMLQAEPTLPLSPAPEKEPEATSITIPTRVDSWDEYFLHIAQAVSIKSKDPKCPVGAVVVQKITLSCPLASMGSRGACMMMSRFFVMRTRN